MKKILTILSFFLCLSVNAQNAEKNQLLPDSLTQEQREVILYFTEKIALNVVDSVIEEGMYMNALEMLDSIQVNWKRVTGSEPSPQLFIKRAFVYMSMEEWRKMAETANECINIHKITMMDREFAIVYNMQGTAFKNIGEYTNSIRAYENSISYYKKLGESGSVGDGLCNMAFCYDKLGKTSAATSFYEKGLSMFLEYFNITKKQLLQKELRVNDSYKKTVKGVLGAQLYMMALFEQNKGDKLASKEYLLMSAHCGNDAATSEYQRIFGF